MNRIQRKKELEALGGVQLMDLVEKYGLKPGKREAVIESILEHEGVGKKRSSRVTMTNTRLKAMRLKKNITQKELAEIADISQRVLQQYEQGTQREIDSARLDVILKLCIALDCEISDILERKETIELYNKFRNAIIK